MRWVALGVVLLTELVAFAAVAAVGFVLPLATVVQWLLVVPAGAVVVGFWGVFMAPRAPRRLAGLRYYLGKSVVYVAAAVVLALAWSVAVAVAFLAVSVVVDGYLLAVDGAPSPPAVGPPA